MASFSDVLVLVRSIPTEGKRCGGRAVNNTIQYQEQETTPLNPALNNRDRDLEMALSEILYYPAWVNISKELGNNWFQLGKQKITVPDGQYDICTLDKQVFSPLKLRLALNPATGLLTNIGEQLELGGIGPSLGFIKTVPSLADGPT